VLTVLSQNRSGLAVKQVEMLREMRPRLATVAILHYRALPGAELVYRAFAEAARERAIATPVMTHEDDDISMPVAEMKRQRIDTAYLLGGGSNLLEVARQGILDPGTAFLSKPFTPDALARKVREVLDSAAET